MKTLDALRARIAAFIHPKAAGGVRMYAGARPSRLAGSSVTNSSADMELVSSLNTLRGRSRQLVRDASYAKRGRLVVMNNVVGTGIGFQAKVKNTRGELRKDVNDAIEAAHEEWSCAAACDTGGTMHLADMERLAMGEVFEAGEIFIRKHRRAFGRSKVPLALEIIEPERIADDIQPYSPQAPGNLVRMGIEVDPFYRPYGYYIRERFQGEFRLGIQRSDSISFVPANDMFHLRILDRWPQTRGVPWMNTVIRRLQDIDGYSEAEIVAARAGANYFASIKSPEDPNTPIGEKQADGSLQAQLEPGIIMKLADGEELVFHSPNRPNSAMDPFMRLMLREVAAGIGTSYESLSRDYSQSNYSSSRLAILDDRDLWRVLQGWFIRNFRYELHREWLMAAVLGGAVPQLSAEAYANDMERYSSCQFKPRGWSWIDPTKEVEAYVKAVRAGFTTVSDVISKTADGKDIEDVLDEREQELAMMEAAGLSLDTDPDKTADGQPIGLTADQTMQQSKQANEAKAEALKNAPKPAAAPAAKPALKEVA